MNERVELMELASEFAEALVTASKPVRREILEYLKRTPTKTLVEFEFTLKTISRLWDRKDADDEYKRRTGIQV